MMTIVKDEKDLQLNSGIVLVDFYADWCGPCKMMTPLLDELSDVYPDITVLKVDTDNFKELSLKYDVTNIPTLDIYENGVKKMRKVGYVPKELLLRDMETNTTFKRKI
jgi:thioredoxin 1